MPKQTTDRSFGQRLFAAVNDRKSAVVVGLDPDPAALWSSVSGDHSSPETIFSAVFDHCRYVIDAVASECVAVKLQLACFERLGPQGVEVLYRVASYSQQAGLLVIADGKRGDIDRSASAYAQSLFTGFDTPYGRITGLNADAATVAPYMGIDSIQPFIDEGRLSGAGIFVLVRTSNPGAHDLQERELHSGEKIWLRTAQLVDQIGKSSLRAGSYGEQPAGYPPLSDVGAVVGATAPHLLETLREAMPQTPWLIPGIGAQGGKASDLAAAFAAGPGSALITASRSIVNAPGKTVAERSGAALDEVKRLKEQTSQWL